MKRRIKIEVKEAPADTLLFKANPDEILDHINKYFNKIDQNYIKDNINK